MSSKEETEALDALLQALWPRLKVSSKRCFLHGMQRLVNDYSGTMQFHCNKGGVRLVSSGQEFRPSDTEFRLGDSNELT